MKTIRDEQIPYELVYNAHETSLLWRYVPRKTLAIEDKKKNPFGIKDMKEHLIVLAVASFWHHLLPTILFNDDNEHDKCDFEGFCVSEREVFFSELLDYANTRNVSLTQSLKYHLI